MHLLIIQVSEFSLFPLSSIFNSTCTARKTTPQIRTCRRACLPNNTQSFPTLSSSNSDTHTKNSRSEHSFTVNYLIKSCGLPPELALSASNKINFFSNAQADSVLAFFKNHGFTKTQISKIVIKFPSFLCSDTGKTFLPKIEFLSSVGLSRTEVAAVISAQPYILRRSLENLIIPNFNLFESLLESHEDAVNMVRRCPLLLSHNHDVHCIEILREMGVPGRNIAASLTLPCRGRKISNEGFRMMVEEVKKMGFDPSTMQFLVAIRTLRSLKKSTREQKIQLFKEWGWSDDEVLMAFKKTPKFIMSSLDKITGIMDFLVNEMGLEACAIANTPWVFTMSLEKRIIPRSFVYKALLEKEVLKKKRIVCCAYYTMLCFSENRFLDWLKTNENEAPGLLKLYQEKLDIAK